MAGPLLLRTRRAQRRSQRPQAPPASPAPPTGDGSDAGGSSTAVAGHERGLGIKLEVGTYLGAIDAREVNAMPIGLAPTGRRSWPG